MDKFSKKQPRQALNVRKTIASEFMWYTLISNNNNNLYIVLWYCQFNIYYNKNLWYINY